MNTKSEDWIVGAGVGVVLILAAVALLPDDCWERYQHHAPDHPVQPDAPDHPAVVNDFAQPYTPAQGRTIALQGLIPFERASTEPYTGTVQQIVSRGKDQGWGQIHIWIADGSGKQQEISLAPDWYLQYLGCSFATNIRVRGTAFRFDTHRIIRKIASNSALYAKEISVNGVRCHLRNDEGFALWSNRLR